MLQTWSGMGELNAFVCGMAVVSKVTSMSKSTWEVAFYLFHCDHGHSVKKLTSQVFFRYDADVPT